MFRDSRKTVDPRSGENCVRNDNIIVTIFVSPGLPALECLNRGNRGPWIPDNHSFCDDFRNDACGIASLGIGSQ